MANDSYEKLMELINWGRLPKPEPSDFLNKYYNVGNILSSNLESALTPSTTSALSTEVAPPAAAVPAQPVAQPVEQTIPTVSTPQVVAPGVRVLTNARRTEPTVIHKKIGLSQSVVDDLIKRIGDLKEGLTELRLPDGTVVKGEAPKPTQPATYPTAVAAQPVRVLNTPQTVLTEGATPPPAEQPPKPIKQGFFSKVGNFLGSPQFGYMLGKIGEAIIPQGSPFQRLSSLGAQLNLSDAYDKYINRLREGAKPEELDSAEFSIIPPELKQQAVQQVAREEEEGMKKEKLELEKRASEFRNKYLKALTGQAEKATAGMLTAEQKMQMEDMNNAVRLALGELNSKDWLGLGSGFALNTKTNELIGITMPNSTPVKVADLNSGDYKAAKDLVATVYMPLAIENRKKEILNKPGGEELLKTLDIVSEFKDSYGTPDFAAVNKYLDEKDRIRAAQDLNYYISNLMQGVPFTQTFLQQQIENNTFIYTDPKSGRSWRMLRLGNGKAQVLEEVK